ncbi:xanthine dehydrogenase family protein subunit M [Alloacidobacterium dinghuense]|uniref:Xanthine dehydrogenase family protein subunit M n=1 Tax=Alloacidobacterium dinghuense TaxID=2763107 RepID=A0A7G8BHN5_9BACT|nr:xanthine dehydrogenase family protein subunit M [Alloacidobacterium dinghuense]QNI32055.1 xanthine dehydrogenase family protein subunit M [Alloacidobacterium dinghuense]
MQTFRYIQAKSIDAAVDASGKFIAGGTTLVDLMKLNVEKPAALVDINGLPLDRIEPTPDGGLKVGALVRNSDLAWNADVRQRYTVLSEALLAGASAQLRNMATTGGNLLQRTRCYYFRDTNYKCNKRESGSGCAALDGFHRIHAVLGTSEHCIATHPSDMAVAMMALEATVHTRGSKGERSIPLFDFYLVPGTTPDKENALEPGELITHVTLPALPQGTRSHYLKLRDRASYEFDLASAAVVVQLSGGRIQHARVAMGGVGTKPWRSKEAEQALQGREANEHTLRSAAEAALKPAKPLRDNAFKVELAKRAIVRALQVTTQTA